MTRAEIIELWNKFKSRPFPREYAGGVEIDGVCVALTDTFLAGCISYFVKVGALDPERVQVLKSCCMDIKRALPHLNREGRHYFEDLLMLGHAVDAQSSH